MTTDSQNTKNNRVENLFRNLQKDPRSVFYSIGNLSKSIVNKANKSVYEKNKVFVNLYKQLEDKNFYQKKIIFLLLHRFLVKKVMLTIQLFTVLVSLLIWYMGILQIPDFWQILLLIQNIVYYWLIYLLLKFVYAL